MSLTVKLRENAPMPMLMLRSLWIFVASDPDDTEEWLFIVHYNFVGCEKLILADHPNFAGLTLRVRSEQVHLIEIGCADRIPGLQDITPVFDNFAFR